jgi:hypothetical protein
MKAIPKAILMFLFVVVNFLPAKTMARGLFDGDYLFGEDDRPYVAPAPPAPINPKIDRHMIVAAEIAEKKAEPYGVLLCWKYVKNALVSSGAVTSRPTTGHACQAGAELVYRYGFVKLPVSDPNEAPLGSVIVYGSQGNHASGHVEIRTKNGYVSDFRSSHPCRLLPFIGVYAKLANS